MEISSLGLTSLPSTINHLKPTSNPKTTFLLSHPFFVLKTSPFSKKTVTHFPIRCKCFKPDSFFKISCTPLINSHKNELFMLKKDFLEQKSLNLQLSVALMAAFWVQFPCYAIESTISTDQASNRIDLESILASIDDFFNRNPFFVSGVVFIWLVLVPVAQEYFRKFKFISAINVFKKLRDDPSAQLLDIRDMQSLSYLGSPNLKILNKKAVQVHFVEGEEEGFVKKVLQNFKDPANTTICVLDKKLSLCCLDV